MTGQLAADEPYATRFETEVSAVDGRTVWLETSYFYAESGGQPADRGTIGDVAVEGVRRVDGEHAHVLAEEPSFRAGHRVLCSIDWSFRMYCMRAHTASHALYGAGRRLLENLGYGGFDIGEEKVRVDLATDTTVDDETLVELDRLVNEVVWESRPVSWEEVPAGEARADESVAFNDAAEEGIFADEETVRLVTIGSADDTGNGNAGPAVAGDPWDVAACGGTHVRNTREIGPVTVLGRSNPGEGVTRVEFAVGPRAIDRREAEKRATLATQRTLGAPVEEVPDELARVIDERDDLRDGVASLRRDRLERELERADAIDQADTRWLVTTVDGIEPDELSDVARERAGEEADVVVIVGRTEYTFAVVGSTGSPPADAVIDDLVDTFGGGGGGSETVAQGGGFDAPPADVVDALE